MLTTTNKERQVTYRVSGLKGMATIWHTGNSIAASADHKQFMPLGATQDVYNPSYSSIRNPTGAQIAEFLRRLAASQ